MANFSAINTSLGTIAGAVANGKMTITVDASMSTQLSDFRKTIESFSASVLAAAGSPEY
jgi:hypothetical protein